MGIWKYDQSPLTEYQRPLRKPRANCVCVCVRVRACVCVCVLVTYGVTTFQAVWAMPVVFRRELIQWASVLEAVCDGEERLNKNGERLK